MAKSKRIQVTLVRSPLSCKPKHRATVRALGLRKIGQTVEHDNTDVIKGMANRVHYLVDVVES